MRKRRTVRDLKSGELFIETPHELWQEALAAWDSDHSKPCPMIERHLMFRFPEAYGCVKVESTGEYQGVA